MATPQAAVIGSSCSQTAAAVLPSAARLPCTVQVAYALPAISFNGVSLLIGTFILRFYADELGASLQALSWIALAAILGDAATDVFFGAAADNVDQTRMARVFGRRGSLFVISVVPFAGFTIFAFSPPDLPKHLLLVWGAVGVVAIYVFRTMAEIPYLALAPELEADYDNRSSLVAVREFFGIMGTIFAAVLPSALDNLFGPRAKFVMISCIYAFVSVVTICICYLAVRGHEQHRLGIVSDGGQSHARKQPVSMFLKDVFGDADGVSARALLLSQILWQCGSGMNAAMFAFFVSWVLRPDPPELEGILLGGYVLVGTSLLPLWVWLGRRLEKKNTLALSLVFQAAGFGGIQALVPEDGSVVVYAACGLFAALGLAGSLVYPAAMRADLCTRDEQLTGLQREASIIGIFKCANKVSVALVAWLTLTSLDVVGFKTSGGRDLRQTEDVVWLIRTLYSGVPSLLLLASVAPLFAYKIDRATHASMLEAIEARNVDPKTIAGHFDYNAPKNASKKPSS